MSRPRFEVDKYALVIVSGVVGISLVAAIVLDQLMVGDNGVTSLMCALVPAQIILILVSVVHFLLRRKSNIGLAALPLILSLVTLALVVAIWHFVPSLELGFRWRLRGYTEVVNLVEQGYIQPDENGDATLPSRFQHLSDGGSIMIFQQQESVSVLFFNTLGILGEYSGYIYRSDDTQPQDYHESGCDRAWRVKTNVPNWFLCVSD